MKFALVRKDVRDATDDALPRERLTFVGENRRLCEAVGRGFPGVMELDAWEDGLPRDDLGLPQIPAPDFHVLDVSDQMLVAYEALLARGYRDDELLLLAADQLEDLPGDTAAGDGTGPTLRADLLQPASGEHDRTLFDAPLRPGDPTAPVLAGDAAARRRRLRLAALEELRALRNERLAESDRFVLPDYPLAPAQKKAWRAYRKALRELPDNVKDPATVRWPEPPE